jgi:predicted DCC family thiol-disulfide oxidoreductase YuxK
MKLIAVPFLFGGWVAGTSPTDEFAPHRDNCGNLIGSRYLIFDGACGLCTACAREAKKLDRQRRFRYVPLQWCTPADFERFGTSESACRRSVHVIDGRTIRRGAFAVNHFFWSIGVGRAAIVAIWCIWPLLVAEILGYALVARNRIAISRLLKTQSCRVVAEEENGPNSADG